MKYTDCTIDLETMGILATSAIVSIGAIAFNRHDETYSTDNLQPFYCNVDLQDCINQGMTLDGRTIQWWLSQSETARNQLFGPTPVPLFNAMSLLQCYLEEFLDTNSKVWTHATFDAPKIENAFKITGLKDPIKFWNQRDIRTLEDLRGKPVNVSFQGTKHCALDDAIYQAECIHKLLSTNETLKT